MKLHWLKFLLLATFAFWASGAAKYTHELLEHHGQDASVDDDDEQSTTAAPAQQDQPHPPVKHACPICQMLAGMAVHASTPPGPPIHYFPLVEARVIADHVAPPVQPAFDHTARGPPTWL